MQIPIRKPDKRSLIQPDHRLTATKLAELEHKLKQLRDVRPRAAEEVKHLSETGDFSENAGYQAAKGRLRGINQRILELENQLKNAELIPQPKDTSSVQLGHRVTVEIDGQRQTFKILGSTETNPGQGVISHNSPIGSALMGHRVGDRVTYRSATKIFECKIVSIVS